jgi:hypothetical protein
MCFHREHLHVRLLESSHGRGPLSGRQGRGGARLIPTPADSSQTTLRDDVVPKLLDKLLSTVG